MHKTVIVILNQFLPLYYDMLAVVSISAFVSTQKTFSIHSYDGKYSPSDDELIPCLIKIKLIQMSWLTLYASGKFAYYLESDPFSLCSDAHFHFPLIILVLFLF